MLTRADLDIKIDVCMTRVLSFLIRYFSNYYTLHRSDLAARAAPLDPPFMYGESFKFLNKVFQ